MLPLEGIKVVDLSTWALAPVCAATLGDWGAEVIKIENPETGDVFRGFLMAIGIDEKEVPVSLFGLDNRNKRGMAIDLKRPEGRDIAYKLVEETDIFVSNLPAESLKKLQLDYPCLSAVNPGLIYAHASGYGEKGPDANKPGFDGTAYWARSGLMAGLAVEDQPPVTQQYPGIGDQVSGLVLFGGVLLALYNREKTGKGQQVDLSLLGMGTWVTSLPLQIVLSLGREPDRSPRDRANNPLVNHYLAGDDRWLMILCLPDELYWSPLCKALGREDLEHDPRFNTRDNRLTNNVELIAILDEAMFAKTRDKWGRILDEHGIVWTPVPSSFEEVTHDPQMLANEHIVEVEHPSLGPGKILTTPIRLNREAPKIRRVAPEIGQHNEEILLEMNYTWEEIVKLKDKGVIP
ncbi:CaiB/BaiF CoA transferase family protein [Thermodesulfobacteriota bacterium]